MNDTVISESNGSIDGRPAISTGKQGQGFGVGLPPLSSVLWTPSSRAIRGICGIFISGARKTRSMVPYRPRARLCHGIREDKKGCALCIHRDY